MSVLQSIGAVLLQRHTRVMGCFVLVLLLAGSEWSGRTVSAADETGINGTLPGGTLPPGGTIPPNGTVPPANAGLVRIVHFAPFDPDLADTALDICTETNQPVAGFTGLVYRSATSYQTFSTGVYDWKVTRPGCGATVVDVPPFTLFNGARLTLNIIGDSVNQPLGTILTVDDIGFPTNLYLPNIRRSA